MNASPLNLAALLQKRQLPDLPEPRRRMVEHLATKRELAHPVLEGMEIVPRHAFAPPQFWRLAYGDYELWAPGSYLARPSVIARIGTELVQRKAAKVLVYAAWTGYEACIWSLTCEELDTVEHDPWLLWAAADAYRELGIRNIHQKASDGQLGWIERSPYDAIVFLAAIPEIPHSLWEQVKDLGAIIAPIGAYGQQQIICVERDSEKRIRNLGTGLFAPLLGAWNVPFTPTLGTNLNIGASEHRLEGARIDAAETEDPSIDPAINEQDRQAAAKGGPGAERPTTENGQARRGTRKT